MSKSLFQKPIEIKISTVVAVSAILATADRIALDAALAEMTGGTTDFFEDDLAVIDVAALPAGGDPVDWAGIIALLKKYRLNPVALRNEFGRLWICRLDLFGRLPQRSRYSSVAAVRSGQRPFLAWNDPLNVFGNQRKQTLPIATAYCCKETFDNLDIHFDAHRISPFLHQVRPIEWKFRKNFFSLNHTVTNRLLLLLEHILKNKLTPGAAACMYQPSALVQLSQLHGCEPQFFCQVRHGCDRVFIVARQKDHPAPSLDLRIGRQLGCLQVIKALNELGVGE